MKCIENSDGKIRRVKDEVAAKMVKSGKATYVPKSKWKEQGRGY